MVYKWCQYGLRMAAVCSCATELAARCKLSSINADDEDHLLRGSEPAPAAA
jgi:hypothetical protein